MLMMVMMPTVMMIIFTYVRTYVRTYLEHPQQINEGFPCNPKPSRIRRLLSQVVTSKLQQLGTSSSSS